jgi:hypothetical protein
MGYLVVIVKQVRMRFIFISILLILTFTVFSQTPRGRVQIKDGTLVTDRGTLLRGAYVSTDISQKLPSKSEVTNIKNLGLNCIHLYAECPQIQNPGENSKLVDSIVKWTRDNSLYLILTIGGCTQNGQFDSAFVKGFWDIYAPRYKNETHLVYEIVNEPFSWSAPYDSATLEMERTSYQIIRNLAPETHILLMSYANAIKDTSIVADVKRLGNSVDWSNASVAIHGYGAASKDISNLIQTIKGAGYALTVTEPASIEDKYVNLATTRVFEKEFVSYTHFISVQSMNSDPSVFKTKVEDSDVRWVSDFSTWPGNISKTTYRTPYLPIIPGFYDEGFGFGIYGKALGSISNNDYAAYFNFDFQNGPDSFEAVCSSAGIGGIIELHLDSLKGPLVGICSVSPTGSWDTERTFSCMTCHFEGIHNLYLHFKGGKWDLFNLNRFVFKKPDATSVHSFQTPDGQVEIFPNPAKNAIHITGNGGMTVKVCDIQGRIRIKKQLDAQNNTMVITDLPPGCYIVRIESETKVQSKKLMIE